MAETQQVETHSDSARFKTAESGLCTLKHALIRQGSRPPNQNCADSTTASLGITAWCLNWGNFHHGIEHIGPKHSAEKRCECTILPLPVMKVYCAFAQRSVASQFLGITVRCVNWGSFHHGIEYIGPKHSTEKLCECNILPMAVTKVYSTFA